MIIAPADEALTVEDAINAVRSAAEASAFYKQKFGTTLRSLRTYEEFCALPVTSRKELRSAKTEALLAVSPFDLVEFHASSGTSDEPFLSAYTQADVEEWGQATAAVLRAAGVHSGDVVQIAFGYGMFTGAHGFEYGIRKLRARIVPSGVMGIEWQRQLMLRCKTTILLSTPSFLLRFAEYLADRGDLDGNACGALRFALCGGEPWSEQARSHIERYLGVRAYDNYGLAEMWGPGVAFECVDRSGLHLNTDMFFGEILKLESNESVTEGELGELVLTSKRKHAMPVVRYRTGDLTRMVGRECVCGSKFPKISRIAGRVDDMFFVGGVNVFPADLERVIFSFPELARDYEIHLYGDTQRTKVRLCLATRGQDSACEQALFSALAREIRSRLGFSVDVKRLDAPLSGTQVKVRRVVDERRHGSADA